MSLLLKQIFQMFRLLNSETGAVPLAAGIACGFVLGMTPFFSLQSVLIFIVIFFFRVQLGAALVSAFFFKFIAFALDPVFHPVGAWALDLGFMQGVYTAMYNLPILPFTRFHNTIVMGSAIVSILLIPVVYFVSLKLILKYQSTVVMRLRQTKIWKAVQATGFYKWYHKYNEYYG